MYKIAAIGDRDSVYGFAALGLDTYFETDPKSAAHTLRSLEKEGCAIIYITEKLAGQLTEELARISEQPLPAVIPIPGVSGNSGMGMRAVSEAVVKAVGSELI